MAEEFPIERLEQVLYRDKLSFMPDYPYIGPGIFQSYIGPLHVVLIDDQLTSEGFWAMLKLSSANVANAPNGFRGASILHAVLGDGWGKLSMSDRLTVVKEASASMKKITARLPELATCVGVVAPSVVTRTAMRTFNALTPRHWPTSVFETGADAFRYCVRLTPDLAPNAELYFAAYRLAVERHVPSLKPSLGSADRFMLPLAR